VEKQFFEVVKEALQNNPRNKTVKAIVRNFGLSQSTVYRWGEDPNGNGLPMPSTMIVPVSEFLGTDKIINFIAEQAGGYFIRIPINNKEFSEVSKEIAKSLKEFGDFINASAESLEDGTITENEIKKIEKESGEAVNSILSLVESFKRRVQR